MPHIVLIWGYYLPTVCSERGSWRWSHVSVDQKDKKREIRKQKIRAFPTEHHRTKLYKNFKNTRKASVAKM